MYPSFCTKLSTILRPTQFNYYNIIFPWHKKVFTNMSTKLFDKLLYLLTICTKGNDTEDSREIVSDLLRVGINFDGAYQFPRAHHPPRPRPAFAPRPTDRGPPTQVLFQPFTISELDPHIEIKSQDFLGS